MRVRQKIEISLQPEWKDKALVSVTVESMGEIKSEAREKIESEPEHSVFMLDKSGSMMGEKIAALKKAVKKIIEQYIKMNDIFSIITFNHLATVVINNAVKSNDNLKELQAIDGISVGGDTAIEEGLWICTTGKSKKIEKKIQEITPHVPITLYIIKMNEKDRLQLYKEVNHGEPYPIDQFTDFVFPRLTSRFYIQKNKPDATQLEDKFCIIFMEENDLRWMHAGVDNQIIIENIPPDALLSEEIKNNLISRIATLEKKQISQLEFNDTLCGTLRTIYFNKVSWRHLVLMQGENYDKDYNEDRYFLIAAGYPMQKSFDKKELNELTNLDDLSKFINKTTITKEKHPSLFSLLRAMEDSRPNIRDTQILTREVKITETDVYEYQLPIIYPSQIPYTRIFLCSDGQNSNTSIGPDEIINKMKHIVPPIIPISSSNRHCKFVSEVGELTNIPYSFYVADEENVAHADPIIQKKLFSSCPVIPITFGGECDDKFLSRLGELTNMPYSFHIKSTECVETVFEDIVAKGLLNKLTSPVSVDLKIGDTVFKFDLGVLTQGQKGTAIEVVDISLLKPGTLLTMSNSLTHESIDHIVSDQTLIENNVIMALHANLLFVKANENEPDLFKRADIIQYEILPLIPLPSDNDTNEIIAIRESMINAIYLFRNNASKTVTMAVTARAKQNTARTGGAAAENVHEFLRVEKKIADGFEVTDQVAENEIQTFKINPDQTLSKAINWTNPEQTNKTLYSVSIANSGEVIEINLDSPCMKKCYEAILTSNKLSSNLQHTKANVIELAKYANNLFIHRDDRRIIHLPKEQNNKKYVRYDSDSIIQRLIQLDIFIQEQTGTCLHIDLVLCSLLRFFISDEGNTRLANGSVRFFSGTIPDGRLSHSWVIYSPQLDHNNVERWLIDPQTPNMVYNLSDKNERDDIIRHYEKWGLFDILEPCLNEYGYLEKQTPLPLEIIMQANNHQIFLDKNLICPISEDIMCDPCSIEGQDTKQQFDRENITQWFQTCEANGRPYTNPITNQVCSSRLVSQPKSKQLIILLLAKQQGYIAPITCTKDAEGVIDKLSEHCSFSSEAVSVYRDQRHQKASAYLKKRFPEFNKSLDSSVSACLSTLFNNAKSSSTMAGVPHMTQPCMSPRLG